MKATSVQIENEDDEFFSLSIYFDKDSFPSYIVICRDVIEEPDMIVYTECLDKLYTIQPTAEEFSYQLTDNVLRFQLSFDSPLYFFTNNEKQQEIELSVNDVRKVQYILDNIFQPIAVGQVVH